MSTFSIYKAKIVLTAKLFTAAQDYYPDCLLEFCYKKDSIKSRNGGRVA